MEIEIVIGKVISERASELLKEFTGSQDRANVSSVFEVGTSTLREITYRNQSVTDKSLPAVKNLLERAISNADEKLTKSRRGKKDLKAIFDNL